MAEKGKQATTANSRPPPPPPPRQEPLSSFAPPTPPPKSRPRKKPNNDFIRDVSKKVNSPAKIYYRAVAELEEEAEGAKSPKQDLSTRTETVELDAHGTTTSPPVQDDKPVWGVDEFDLLSLEHKAAENLYKRPKSDEINEAITVNVSRVAERLKDLSMNTEMVHTPDTVIYQGLLIADSVSLLKLKTSSSKFMMAGQKAQRAATLMLQAQMMSDKAKELLAESKDLLRLQPYKNGEFSA